MKYMAVALLMLSFGCSDWLDVKPRTEVLEDDVYNSEDGFRSVLNGVYIRMAEQDLYGKNVSMYLPELLARHWYLSYPQIPYYIGNYQYDHASVEDLIERVWKKYFECIAHLNDLLANAKQKQGVFTESGYQLITGEALGLRAFLHFELLRWFGPVPELGMDMNQKAVPYMEELTKDPNKMQILTYEEVTEKILRDLNAAEDLLKDDPIIKSLDNSVTGEKDDWMRFRQSRFNLYAVKGVKARFYQWLNDPVNAVKYAREVIEAKNDDGKDKFILVDASYMNRPDNGDVANLVFLREHLFGVHNPKLESIVQPLFLPASGSPVLYQQQAESAYEVNANPDDIRYTGQRYWSGLYKNFRKYLENGEQNTTHTVPVIRLAEMYLILMEELPLNEALPYFADYRKARNLTASMEQSFATETASRIEKEYRKEFFGEGVMFFYYKRHKTTRLTWPSTYTFKEENYVLPVPANVQAFE